MTIDRLVQISAEVADAAASKRPIVAFESTVYSTLGLPEPVNRETHDRACAAVHGAGAVPALTGVIDGRPVVGAADPSPLFTCDRKVAARDLAVAVAQRWPAGVTTVGASLTLAHAAGLSVFATGGIGGVHRNAAETGDVSGDLGVIAALPMITVCAGAKSFLDLPQTLERLETLGVVVIGWGTDRLPAFTALDSGLDVPHSTTSADEVASILAARRDLGQGGILVCVPPPHPIDPDELHQATHSAESAANHAGITGPARTPFVLAQLAELTNGRSIESNTALVVNNATVAAELAVAIEAG